MNYYCPQQSNVFTPVCQSFYPQGRCVPHLPGQTPPQTDTPPGRHTPCLVHAGIHTPPYPVHAGIHPLCSVCWDMVNNQVVCILLECILIFGVKYRHCRAGSCEHIQCVLDPGSSGIFDVEVCFLMFKCAY